MKKSKNYLCMFLIFLFLSPILYAAPTVYIPLGSANKVIAVNALTDQIIATYTGILNPHCLVATPDGEYLIAGSLNEAPLTAKQSQKTANSLLYLAHPNMDMLCPQWKWLVGHITRQFPQTDNMLFLLNMQREL